VEEAEFDEQKETLPQQLLQEVEQLS